MVQKLAGLTQALAMMMFFLVLFCNQLRLLKKVTLKRSHVVQNFTLPMFSDKVSLACQRTLQN